DGSQGRHHVQPAAAGHAKIDHRALRRVLGGHPDGVVGAGGSAHLVTTVAERPRHPLAKVLVVVDEEDGERGHVAGTGGTVKQARVPCAGAESRCRSPPSCSARLRATNSPRPSPWPEPRVLKNGSPARASTSGAIPSPWSSTSTRSRSRSRPRRRSTGRPAGGAWSALRTSAWTLFPPSRLRC